MGWNDVTGATAYELEEDDNSAFTSPTVRYTGANTEYQVTEQEGGTWYYRVRASNAGGNSAWSNTESVGVDQVPLEAPVLYPIDNSDWGGEYLVDWSAVTGATGYLLEEDNTPYFDSPVVRYEGIQTEFNVTGQQKGIWYYRVRAYSVEGSSPWSATQSATVGWKLYVPMALRAFAPGP